MALDEKRLTKPLKKLGKELRRIDDQPGVEQVHDLRTNIRRVEAALQTVKEDPNGNERRLLKLLGRVRKRAGKVRDMDVLTAYAAGLKNSSDEQECLVQLLEHLGGRRVRDAGKLYKAAHAHRSELARRMKDCRRSLRKQVRRAEQNGVETHATSDALEISAELGRVHRLTADNLHQYRLTVKRLQYVLQLADEEHQDKPFIEELKRVKDSIGEWHDWQVLTAIATKLLKDHGCNLVKSLESTTSRKLKQAMAVTEKLRERYLRPKVVSSRKQQVQPALAAISGIAA